MTVKLTPAAALNMDRAQARVIMTQPFFAAIMLQHPFTITDAIPTAATNAYGRLMFNPKFVEALEVDQLVHLICHEIMHYILDHPGRLNHRDPKRWNIACDAVINDILVDAGCGRQIAGGVYMDGARAKSEDQVYNELPEMPEGPGGAGMDLDYGNDGEEGNEPVSASDREAHESRLRSEVAAAAQVARMAGKFGGRLAEIVADIINVETPWYDKLERFMESFRAAEYSWKRPNRRYVTTGHYLPSIGSVPSMGTVVLQVDVSGSISKAELDHYNGHIKRIVEQCNPEEVHVIYVDTGVVKHETFAGGEEVNLNFYSGGGTDMEAGFNYVEDQGIQPDVLVCLTDGYTGFTNAPSMPVVWCCSTDVVPPYGDLVPFKIHEKR